jgi:hypothetical protein
VILMLFTPIADPARLAVDDQVGRLLAGKTAPDKFDFEFLTYKAGSYGADALQRLTALKGSPRNVQIAQLAVEGRKAQQPFAILGPAPLAERLNVYPAKAQLPASFLAQDWAHDEADSYQPGFNNINSGKCDAYVLDIDGDGVPEVLLTQETEATTVDLDIYKLTGGRWAQIGMLNINCADAVAALKAGAFKLVPRTGFDVEVAGRRQVLTLSQRASCPPPPSPQAGAKAGGGKDYIYAVSPSSHGADMPER